MRACFTRLISFQLPMEALAASSMSVPASASTGGSRLASGWKLRGASADYADPTGSIVDDMNAQARFEDILNVGHTATNPNRGSIT